MSRSNWRRFYPHVFATIALALLAVGSLALSVATARSTSLAVRSALLPVVNALAQAQPPAAELPPGGSAPAAPDAAAIERVAVDYLEAIDAGEWEAGWALTHPDTRGGIEMDGWALPQIAEQGSGLEERWRYELSYALPTLMMGADIELGRIVTQEMSGWAELTVHAQFPGTLILRRLGDGWALDLEATRQAEAREAVTRQLEAFGSSENDPYQFMRSMMMAEGDGLNDYSLIDLVLSPRMDAEFRVDEVRVAGDEATVRVTGLSLLRLAMPLANGDRGWSMAWCREPVLLDPGMTFEEAMAGKLREEETTRICQSNLKQLSLAMLMYCQDYDERFPPADRWCAATYPYTRNRAIHHCPADDAPFSYAFNYKLSRQPLSAIDDLSMTIMLYESEIGKGDAFDWPDYPGTSLPDPGRHEDANNYAYADGHVRLDAPWSCMVEPEAYQLKRPERMPPGMEGMPGMEPGMEPEPPCEE